VEGGTIYTFTLRANARFHDGRPVMAYDVVYSWERAADPEIESDTVLTYLGDIVGVKEMREGRADHIAGLRVIDERTLQVTIDAPKPYFLYKLTYSTAFVVDRANVGSGPDWYRTPNGTGPYRLVRWDRFELMLYERYADYHLEPPAIPYVVVRLYAGVGMRMYEMDDIDVTGVSYSNVQRVLDPDDPLHADLLTSVNLCTGFIVFDVEQPPFDDPKVRQAFTMAFNRQQVIDLFGEGIPLPAKGPYPPGLPGYNADLEGLPYDPARARQLLAESKYGGPEGLPPIVYTNGGYGSYVGDPLAEMWERNLGVAITVEFLEPNKYQDKIDAGYHGQIFDGGWCADYPDPQNFADVLFHSDSMQNEGHYSNPQLDALLERARVEQDVDVRLQMYQQAEQMIVEDAPVLFTTHSLSYVLVKPHIKGYVLTPVAVPLVRFLWIDPEGLAD
jgi:oligopeptide transport system substrate-binding protein